MRTFWAIFLVAAAGALVWIFSGSEPNNPAQADAPAAVAPAASVASIPAPPPAPEAAPEPASSPLPSPAADAVVAEVAAPQPDQLAPAQPVLAEPVPAQPATVQSDAAPAEPAPVETVAAEPEPAPAPAPLVLAELPASVRTAEALADVLASLASDTEADPAADPDRDLAADLAAAPASRPAIAAPNAPVEPAPAASAAATPALTELAATTPPITLSDTPAAQPAAAPAPPAAPAPAAVVQNPDGSLTIDGRWTLPGAGTAESPYRLDWELLVSASKTYNPRLKKTTLPAWVQALDGKHVAIDGYLMMPQVGNDIQELLVMRNQWDGCCIGVEPTPYDAIEVKLAKALDARAMLQEQALTRFGRITGVLKTDPYIVSGWLLGLYLLNDAALTTQPGGNN